MSEEEEIAAKLAARQRVPEEQTEAMKNSIYAEFKEFSIKEIKEIERIFKKYDIDRSNFIDQMELKLMMEKLEAPQTYDSLKQMISEVDEDNDGQISLREFLLIFRKAEKGELKTNRGLYELYRNVNVIDIDSEFKDAAGFFEPKIKKPEKEDKFEEEIRKEHEEKKKTVEDARARKAGFKEKANLFHRP